MTQPPRSATVTEFFDGITKYWDKDGDIGPIRNRAPDMIAVHALIDNLKRDGRYQLQVTPHSAMADQQIFAKFDDQEPIEIQGWVDMTINIDGRYVTHRESIVDSTRFSVIFWETYMILQVIDTMVDSADEVQDYCLELMRNKDKVKELIADEY